MLEGNVFEDDDGVLGGVLLQEGLEVGRAGGEDHLVGLAGLSVARQGDVGEGLFVPEVLERRDHVGLEVVPPKAELLLVSLRHPAGFFLVVWSDLQRKWTKSWNTVL